MERDSGGISSKSCRENGSPSAGADSVARRLPPRLRLRWRAALRAYDRRPPAHTLQGPYWPAPLFRATTSGSALEGPCGDWRRQNCTTPYRAELFVSARILG